MHSARSDPYPCEPSGAPGCCASLAAIAGMASPTAMAAKAARMVRYRGRRALAKSSARQSIDRPPVSKLDCNPRTGIDHARKPPPMETTHDWPGLENDALAGHAVRLAARSLREHPARCAGLP